MRSFISFALIALAALVSGCASDRVARDNAASVLKIMVGDGHGSGVYVGHGYAITASHVVGKESSVGIKLMSGETRVGEVLWANSSYDIALLHLDDAKGMKASVLDCRTANDGEVIVARGNPMMMEFITSYGHVSGTARSIGPWKVAFIADATIIPGMSGGPVFDDDGKVIGISVGVITAPMGIGASMTGFGLVVPSSTVCMLMGR